MNICETLSYSVRKTQESLASLVGDIPEKLAHQKPDGAGWSVVECMEHLFLVEKGIVKLLGKPDKTDAVNAENAADQDIAPEKCGAGKIKHLMSDRATKYPAPENFAPKGLFSSLAEAKTALAALRAELATKLSEGKINFRSETFPHPILGDFSKADWVNFLLEHASRHYHQIEELKMVGR